MPAGELVMGRSKRSKQRASGQLAGVNAHLHAGMKATLAALDDLLSANGLTPADVKAYIDPQVVHHARADARQGWGLTAARLEELQEGLAKLQAEGVLEGLQAAKAAKAQRVAAERRPAANPPPTKRRRASTNSNDSELVGGGGGGGGGGVQRRFGTHIVLRN